MNATGKYGQVKVQFIDNVENLIPYAKGGSAARFFAKRDPKAHVYPAHVFVYDGDVVVLYNGDEIKFGLVLGYTPEPAAGAYHIMSKFDVGDTFVEEKRAARRERLLEYMEARLQQVQQLRKFEEAAAGDDEMRKLLDEYRASAGLSGNVEL